MDASFWLTLIIAVVGFVGSIIGLVWLAGQIKGSFEASMTRVETKLENQNERLGDFCDRLDKVVEVVADHSVRMAVLESRRS